MGEIPYIVVGEGELGVEDIGEYVDCPNCGQEHKVEYGETLLADGRLEPSEDVSYISCKENGKLYLVGLCGKRLPR